MADEFVELGADEVTRLKRAVAAAYAIPWIDDVEDYVWEAIFHYVKGIRLADPIREGRTKKLFDAVSPDGCGWSLKTLLWPNHAEGAPFEFVIQRADITTKAAQLGFVEGLTRDSPVEKLGAALIRHWNAKFQTDSADQKVTDPRFAILLKNLTRDSFVYIERRYPALAEDAFEWQWSNANRAGLQGRRGGLLTLRWYFNQKQLFEVDRIPEEALRFTVEWTRMDQEDFMTALLPEVEGRTQVEELD